MRIMWIHNWMKRMQGQLMRTEPTAGKELDLRQTLSTRPPPILDSRNKLILIWSAKSGCTFAIKWMFAHMGLLEEVLEHHRWIHKFRGEKLYTSEAHKASVDDFISCPDSYRVIRIVRDPFKRAVSSYVHAARCGYEDAKIATFVGRVISKSSGYSFREFVSYLETIDLSACDPHHRLQHHPCERFLTPGSRFVIDLDQSMEALPKLERLLGLRQTDLHQFRESRHHTRAALQGNAEFSGDTPFNHLDKARSLLPDYRRFYDGDLELRVYNLYADDFLKYGFPTALDP